ncbi:tyrosine-type recombinase/integrase [Actinocorallia sp. A-T 12471]|uniref:tyrosine-type recombinase/integrase n=1 Tax=Actinocorallia sp. A-T 12471 TaxID=3089813 RepID=UPI0029D37BF8|nr:tyrosine-type recombinase/integrase [Actinocorallia sp. A-T 12471]MDX6738614.1 tyrosine-type recombinase/integrase [Actinocorallia sp. A-T 12471]
MASVLKKCECPEPKFKCGHPWTVRYREPGGRAASQREKSFRLKKEADFFANKVESDKNAGVFIDPERGKIPVKVWAYTWLDGHAVAEQTRRNYVGFIENHLIPQMGRKTIAAVTATDVRTLQRKMRDGGLAASTVNDRINILRTMLNFAAKDKRIAESPCAVVKPLKATTAAVDEDKIPTLAEVNAIRAAISPQYRLTIDLMAGAGLRISEALAFADDSRRDGFLRIKRQVSSKSTAGSSKTRFAPLKHRVEGEYRDVPTALFLDEEIDAHLEEWGTKEVDGLNVFFSPRERGKGLMPTATSYGYHFRKAVEKAGLEGKGYTPHSLRHFFASTALGNGVPILEVSRWLGHRSIKTTADIYGHLTPEAPDRFRKIMQGVFRPAPALTLAA